jgi:DNA (cytosine-5)-methyltransferase 1
VHKKDGDPRERLVDRYAQIIATLTREKGIAFFVFENVPGLLTQRHRARYESFKRKCSNAGFAIREKVVDAVRFGVPQYRRRLIVVGIHKDWDNGDFEIPDGDSEPIAVGMVLKGLPEPVYFRRGLKPEDTRIVNPRSGVSVSTRASTHHRKNVLSVR